MDSKMHGEHNAVGQDRPRPKIRRALKLARHRLGPAAPIHPHTTDVTVAVGDSITVGHHVPGMLARDSFVDVLAHRAVLTHLANRGKRGSASEGVARRAADDITAATVRVIALVGTNDILFRQHLDTLSNLEIIRALAAQRGAQLIVGLLPPIDTHPGPAQALNGRIRDWAALHPAVLTVDLWTPLAAADGRFKRGMSSDGIHPTPTGARVMADATEAALTTMPPSRHRLTDVPDQHLQDAHTAPALEVDSAAPADRTADSKSSARTN